MGEELYELRLMGADQGQGSCPKWAHNRRMPLRLMDAGPTAPAPWPASALYNIIVVQRSCFKRSLYIYPYGGYVSHLEYLYSKCPPPTPGPITRDPVLLQGTPSFCRLTVYKFQYFQTKFHFSFTLQNFFYNFIGTPGGIKWRLSSTATNYLIRFKARIIRLFT